MEIKELAYELVLHSMQVGYKTWLGVMGNEKDKDTNTEKLGSDGLHTPDGRCEPWTTPTRLFYM
jgi:hypothetical protein